MAITGWTPIDIITCPTSKGCVDCTLGDNDNYDDVLRWCMDLGIITLCPKCTDFFMKTAKELGAIEAEPASDEWLVAKLSEIRSMKGKGPPS